MDAPNARERLYVFGEAQSLDGRDRGAGAVGARAAAARLRGQPVRRRRARVEQADLPDTGRLPQAQGRSAGERFPRPVPIASQRPGGPLGRSADLITARHLDICRRNMTLKGTLAMRTLLFLALLGTFALGTPFAAAQSAPKPPPKPPMTAADMDKQWAQMREKLH